MLSSRETLRAAAVAIGGLLVVAGVGATPILAFIVLLGVAAPNAYDIEGDPCCSTPDSWGETADGVGASLVVVYVVALLLTLAVALLRWGLKDRPTRRLTVVLRVPAAATGVAAVLAAVSLFLQRDQAHTATRCSSFAFRASDWRSTDRERWQRAALGLGDCRVLEGATSARVRAVLGEPDYRRTFKANRYNPRSVTWGYRDALYVSFRPSRVTDVSSDLFVE